MAQLVLLHEEKFFCSMCQDLLKEPVTLPCGHNYCCSCIEAHWDDSGKRRVRCPECRHIMSRPVLKKNNLLAEVVDIIEKTELEDARPDDCYAGPGDVACDTCRKRKLIAVETCLQCLLSYCDKHVQPHYQSPAFKNHKLVKVSGKLHGDICILQVIQETEEEANVLQEEGETINYSADRSERNSDTLFAELISSIERRRSEVREHIRDQQRREVKRADEQRKRAEQALTELRSRHAELEQLSLTEDPIHVPHISNSLSRISESTHPVISNVRPLRYFEDVTLAVSKMRGKLEAILKEEGTNVSDAVNRVDVLLSTPEPKTRAEFLKYALAVTLDPNTNHQFLALSEGNRKVQNTTVVQGHPPHPLRFGECWQCLGTEALTGRHYWELEWGGDYVDIAVSYPDTPRCADSMERRYGLMDDTWCVQVCDGDGSCYRHCGHGNDISISVNSRIGVYLDHSAGILSWHSVSSDTMTLLKRVKTIFTRPILPGFWVCDMATMVMCHDIKKSSEK